MPGALPWLVDQTSIRVARRIEVLGTLLASRVDNIQQQLVDDKRINVLESFEHTRVEEQRCMPLQGAHVLDELDQFLLDCGKPCRCHPSVPAQRSKRAAASADAGGVTAPPATLPWRLALDRVRRLRVLWPFLTILLFLRGRFWRTASCLDLGACLAPLTSAQPLSITIDGGARSAWKVPAESLRRRCGT